MSKYVAKAIHPVNGSIQDIWEGFSWPCLLFGCFWFGYKGLWGWAFMSLVLAVLTFGFSWLLLPFFANGLCADMLRKEGYLTEKEASARNIAATTQQARSSSSTADELTKLAALMNQGILTEDEFRTQKAKVLGLSGAAQTPAAPPQKSPSLIATDNQPLHGTRLL